MYNNILALKDLKENCTRRNKKYSECVYIERIRTTPENSQKDNEKTEPREADRAVGVNCNIYFQYFVRHGLTSSGYVLILEVN